MYEVARRSAALAAATGGLLLVGVGCASADSIVQTTTDGAAPPAAVSLTGLDTVMAKTGGVLSGNNVAAPLTLPVNLCGIAVLGSIEAQSCSTGGTTSSSRGASSSALGVLSGNVVQAPMNLPLNLHDLDVLGSMADSDAGSCSCSPDSSTAGAAKPAPAASDIVKSKTEQTETAADTASTSSSTVWSDIEQGTAFTAPQSAARVPYVAEAVPAAEKSTAHAAGTSTAVSSIAMRWPASVPLQGPAAVSKDAVVANQVLLPAAATANHLAETGINVAPSLCAAGTGLVSGAALSTFAIKAKAAAGQS